MEEKWRRRISNVGNQDKIVDATNTTAIIVNKNEKKRQRICQLDF